MKGRLLFSGISVDPTTGEVVARIIADNPDGLLLPGMYVRARLPRLSMANAITVPIQAVAREAEGSATIAVVERDHRVARRRVTLGEERDGRIVVTRGLRSGDLVVVEGQDRTSAGDVVHPVAWRNAASGH